MTAHNRPIKEPPVNRLMTIALAALLPVGAASAYDAAECTKRLTGTWVMGDATSSLTLILKQGGAATVEVNIAGEPLHSSAGKWSASAGPTAKQCKLATFEGEVGDGGDETLVTITDADTIELAEAGVFTRKK